jgi:hypothetical protein
VPERGCRAKGGGSLWIIKDPVDQGKKLQTVRQLCVPEKANEKKTNKAERSWKKERKKKTWKKVVLEEELRWEKKKDRKQRKGERYQNEGKRLWE